MSARPPTSHSGAGGGGAAAAAAAASSQHVALSYPFVASASEQLSLSRLAAEHTGLMRVRRLLYIAERCPPLSVEAFRLALTDLKKAQALRHSGSGPSGADPAALSAPAALGPNPSLYRDVVTRANELLLTPSTQAEHAFFLSAGASAGVGSDATFALDQPFYNSLVRSFNESSAALEQQLQMAKRDGERDQIKTAALNLALLYLNRGDVNAALNRFLEAKEFLAPPQSTGGAAAQAAALHQHNLELLHIALCIIKCSCMLLNMSHVRTQVQRAQRIVRDMQAVGQAAAAQGGAGGAASAAASSGPTEKEERDLNVVNCKLNAAHGLFHLKGNAYHSAAQCFVQVTSDIQGHFSDVVSGGDIATYGSICALASFSRKELKEQLLNNVEFKKLQDTHAPHWKTIVQQFYNSNYAKVFEMLEAIKSDLYLDLFLSSHVNRLIRQIRERAFIQYFKAYVSVSLSSMSSAFNLDVVSLERVLAELIQEGKIAARIDSQQKILHARHSDQRNDTFAGAMSLGNKYASDVRALLMRLSLVEHELAVRGADNKRKGAGGARGSAAAAAIDDMQAGPTDVRRW